MDRLLNVTEAANSLRVSPHTIRAWQFQRKIPVVRIGRKVLFREKDLQALVEEGFQDRRPSLK